MALYLIAFNDEWTPDLTMDEIRDKTIDVSCWPSDGAGEFAIGQ